MVTLQEIEENDYNLNIPQYVDTFEEEDVNLEVVSKEIQSKRPNWYRMIINITTCHHVSVHGLSGVQL